MTTRVVNKRNADDRLESIINSSPVPRDSNGGPVLYETISISHSAFLASNASVRKLVHDK